MANWWEDEENFRKVVEAASSLISSNSRMFALGQSPAWIVKTASVIASEWQEPMPLMFGKASGMQPEFGYIPFSAGHYENIYWARLGQSIMGIRGNIQSESPFDPEFKDMGVFRKIAEPQYKEKYIGYLGQIGADPGTIVNKFTGYGIQTNILEHTQSGRSLASFLAILFESAREKGIGDKQLLDSLKITPLIHEGLEWRNRIHIPAMNLTVECKPFPMERELILGLANSQDKERIVPRYSPVHGDWKDLPALQNPNSTLVNEITTKLQAEVSKFMKERAAERERERLKHSAETSDHFNLPVPPQQKKPRQKKKGQKNETPDL